MFDCCDDDELPEDDPALLDEIPEVELPEEEPNEVLDEVPLNELPVEVPNKLEEIPDAELPDDDELVPGRMTVKVPD